MFFWVIVLFSASFNLLWFEVECSNSGAASQPGFYGPILHPGSGGFLPYNQPIGYNPALFSNPDTHSFNFGVEENHGDFYNLDGNLKFPVIDRNRGTFIPWHLAGDLGSGPDHTAVDYGHALKGVNPHKLPFDQIYPCLFGLCGAQPQTVVMSDGRADNSHLADIPAPAGNHHHRAQHVTHKQLVLTPTNPAVKNPSAKRPSKPKRLGSKGQRTRQPQPQFTPPDPFVGVLVGRGVDTMDTEGVDPSLLLS